MDTVEDGMNTLTVTHNEISARETFEERADLLRSRGAPIPEGETHFDTDYVVTVHVTETREPGEFPQLAYRYEWEKKH